MAMTKAIPDICPKFAYVDGHASAATVTGMKAEDTIISVLHFTDDTGYKLTDDITASCAASSTDGSMTCPDTAEDKLLVLFHSADGLAASTFRGLDIKVAAVTGGDQAAELTCTGIQTTDTIIGCFHLTAGVFTSAVTLSYVSIPAANKIAVSADYEATTGDTLLTYWISSTENVGDKIHSPCIKSVKASTVAAPASAITVTGMETEDTILSVQHFDSAGVWQADDTANCSVSTTADAKMYSTTTFGATDEYLWVLYHDASA